MSKNSVAREVLRGVHPPEDATSLRYESAKPSWLDGDPRDNIWRFACVPPGVEPSSATVNWDHAWGGARVSTGARGRWIAYGKALCYCLMERIYKKHSGPVISREIRSVCRWFSEEARCPSISEVSKRDLEAYERHLGEAGLSASSVESKLFVLKKMWEFRSVVGEGLTFAPYIRRKEIKLRANKLGVRNERTPAIKPSPYFRLIDQALKVIQAADKWIDLLDIYSALPKSNRARRFGRVTASSSAVLHRELRVLYGAALVVILALSGERKHELAGTTMDDIKELLDGSGRELFGTVHKTAKTESGKKTTRPAIEELRRALQVVERITRTTRGGYRGQRLFIRLPFWHSASKNPNLEINSRAIYSLIDAFAKSVGHTERLRPHMFRKTFSMIWMWRYEIGDLQMLSRMLYHNNEHFTRCYIESDSVWEFMREGERSLAFEFMERALVDDAKFSGEFGKTLESYRRNLLAVVSVMRPRRIAEHIANQFGDDFSVIVRDFGYCIISGSRAEHAKCAEDGVPNFRRCGHVTCAECGNLLVTEGCKSYWVAVLRAHTEVARTSEVPLLMAAAERGIAMAQRVLNGFEA